MGQGKFISLGAILGLAGILATATAGHTDVPSLVPADTTSAAARSNDQQTMERLREKVAQLEKEIARLKEQVVQLERKKTIAESARKAPRLFVIPNAPMDNIPAPQFRIPSNPGLFALPKPTVPPGADAFEFNGSTVYICPVR